MLSGLAGVAEGNDALRGLSSVVDSAGRDETVALTLTTGVTGTTSGSFSSGVSSPSWAPASGVGGLILMDGVGQLALSPASTSFLPIPICITLAGASGYSYPLPYPFPYPGPYRLIRRPTSSSTCLLVFGMTTDLLASFPLPLPPREKTGGGRTKPSSILAN